MSSAILYLAIVAIWAGVLVPRWLRLRSASAAHPAAELTEDLAPEVDQPGEPEAGRAEPGRVAAPAARERVPAPARELSPDERRARVLRARRRMLTAVVLITAAGAATALLGVAPGWVIIPPVLMLAGSLVLLRDAAHSDAERAHRLAAQAHSSAEADGETDDAEREAAAAAAPASAEAPGGEFGEATAQVIDISARLADQLYDQYADAAERAVGD